MKCMMNKKERRNTIPSEISPAAELIAGNVDLLTEILLYLPAKCIIRFKTVSKRWLSFLSDYQFATNHSSRNPRPSISDLYFYSKTTLNSVSLHGRRRNLPSLPSFPDVLGDPSRTTVILICSCNGLLLLLCYKRHTNYYNNYGRQFIICNLTTKQYKILPCSHPFALTDASSFHAYLAFDPSRSPHYKVLLIMFVFRLPFQIDVYCSKRKDWKQISTQQRYHASGGVFWNGAFHLLCHDNGIWRFDVDAEEMKVIPTPQTPEILTHEINYFGESGGNLVLIQSCQRYDTGLQILEMDKDYCGWMVKCRVDLRPLILEMTRNYRTEVKVMHVVKEDKENDFALALSIPDKIISFNLKWKTWNVVHEFGQGQGFHFTSFGAFPFIESLSPV